MKKFRTIVSLIAMVLAGVVGFFLGSALERTQSKRLSAAWSTKMSSISTF